MPLSDNSRGALLMAFAMAVFAGNDALVKILTSHLGIAQIMAVRGAMTTALVYMVARHYRRPGDRSSPLRVLSEPLVLLRTVCELGATLCYFSALAHLEFATASAIMQALPLAVTLGAAVFLGEQVGWRRWSAILVGLAGVLLILRPGSHGFEPATLYAVGALLCTASRDLVTRRISADIPSISITLFTAFANAALGAVLIVPMGDWRPIDGSTFGVLVLTSVLVFAGYQGVIMAMRVGEISFVAPFRYTSLLWGLAISLLVFDEHLGGSMLAGAAIVIGSGLYTFYRERRRRQINAGKAEAPPPGSLPGPIASAKSNP